MYPGQFKAQEVFEQLLVNLKNADNEVVLMDLKILAKTGKIFFYLYAVYCKKMTADRQRNWFHCDSCVYMT